jgi:hypothetical protein
MEVVYLQQEIVFLDVVKLEEDVLNILINANIDI